jgi:hypothetical protein
VSQSRRPAPAALTPFTRIISPVVKAAGWFKMFLSSAISFFEAPLSTPLLTCPTSRRLLHSTSMNSR